MPIFREPCNLLLQNEGQLDIELFHHFFYITLLLGAVWRRGGGENCEWEGRGDGGN